MATEVTRPTKVNVVVVDLEKGPSRLRLIGSSRGTLRGLAAGCVGDPVWRGTRAVPVRIFLSTPTAWLQPMLQDHRKSAAPDTKQIKRRNSSALAQPSQVGVFPPAEEGWHTPPPANGNSGPI
jgi:hypothetical protein